VSRADPLAPYRGTWVIIHGIREDFTPARWLCAVRRCPLRTLIGQAGAARALSS